MIITIAGQKGGSGKTTTSICLADEWLVRGQSVLLVDADPQLSLTTWAAVAAECGHEVPTVVAMADNLHRPDQLPRLAANFDTTIIDCPPANGRIQRAALMVADLAIVPCGPSSMEINALSETVDLLLAAQSVRPELKTCLLITRTDGRTVLAKMARQRMAVLEIPILTNELPHRISYQHLPDAGLGLTRYQPESSGADEVRRLVDEIEIIMNEAGSDAQAA